MKYQAQRGHEFYWEDIEKYPRNQEDLKAWKEIVFYCDTYSGKYQYRIIDENGKVVAHYIESGGDVRIDICSDPALWMNDIKYAYSVGREVWATACIKWLEKYNTFEKENKEE